eukprot:m.202923 g.202923  ORF g.202923 m.202923 type:complete len:1050 (-) comp18444_c0_seq3:44-3193(-)
MVAAAAAAPLALLAVAAMLVPLGGSCQHQACSSPGVVRLHTHGDDDNAVTQPQLHRQRWMACRANVAAGVTAEALSLPLHATRGVQGNGATLLTPPSASQTINASTPLPQAECMEAVVPGTIMTSLLANGTFPGIRDPFVDDNLARLPDINTTGKAFYTFIYHTDITPSVLTAASRIASTAWLELRGVSYRARVFVNGEEVVPEQATPAIPHAAGMFHRWSYKLGNLQDLLKGAPVVGVAILVEPPDHPGSVAHGGQGGDHSMAKNAAAIQFTAGWDWVRPTPDRNTGLWDEVTLFVSSNARLRDLVVRSHVHGDSAQLLAEVDVLVDEQKGAGDSNAQLTVRVSVLGTNCATTHSVSALPGRTTVALPPMTLPSPQLWWPHTLGHPHLYQATCEIITTSGDVIASLNTTFGIRTVETEYDPTTGGRVFRVNGVKLFLEGGNWITTDQFLRHSTSAQRYLDEVKMHVHMGLNAIRVWGGGVAERPEFYDAADRLGVVVMQEFWMTGDNNGRWAGNHSWPLDHDVYLANAQDTVKLLRSHPSLLFWCGGNELYPPLQSPPSDIAKGLKSIIHRLDPGRFYIPSSMSNWTNWDPEYALAPKDGPYGYLDERNFIDRNPGLLFWNGSCADSLLLGFQPEIGSSSQPVFASLQRFLTPGHLGGWPSRGAGVAANASVPSVFAFHNYLSFTEANRPEADHVYAYGAPGNLSEYCVRAQLAQHTQAKALFEGYQRFMWTRYTAVFFWKTMSPWPALRGAMYDSYLAPTGGLWGVRTAVASRLHVQLSHADLAVTVVNKGTNALQNARVVVTFFHISGVYKAQAIVALNTTVPVTPALSALTLEQRLVWPAAYDRHALLARLKVIQDGRVQANEGHDASEGHEGNVGRPTVGGPTESGDTPNEPVAVLARNEYWLTNPVRWQNYSDTLGKLRAVGALLHLDVRCDHLNDTRARTLEKADLGEAVAKVSVLLPGNAHDIAVAVEVELHHAGERGSFLDAGDSRVLPSWPSTNQFCLLPGESQSVTVATTGTHALSATHLAVTVHGWNVVSKTVQCLS